MRVADLIPDLESHYPAGSLSPKGQKILALELPANASPELQSRIAALTAQALPRFTTAAQTIQRTRAEAGAREQQIQSDYAPGSPVAEARKRAYFQSLPAAARFGMQAGVAGAEFIPIPGIQTTGNEIPPPQGAAEHVGRLLGSVGGFTVAAAPLTAITGGLGIPAAAAVGAGLAAAIPKGTLGQRVVRAGTTALTAGVAGAAGGRVAEAIGGGPAAQTVSHAVAGGVGFGAVQPQLEHRILGEPAPKVSEMLTSGSELAALTLLLGGRSFVGRRPPPPTGGGPPAPVAPEAVPAQEPGAPSIATPEQRGPLLLPSPRPAAPDPRIMEAYNNLPDGPPIPTLGGKTPRQALLTLVQGRAATAEDIPAALEWARGQVEHAVRLQEHLQPPPVPKGAEELAKRAPAFTIQLQRTLGAIAGQHSVDVPGVGRIEDAAFVPQLSAAYPWDPARAIRVVVADRATGNVYPASFRNVDELSQAIGRPALERPAAQEVPAETQARIAALERNVALGGPKAAHQERRLARLKAEAGVVEEAAATGPSARLRQRRASLDALERQIRENPGDKRIGTWKRRAAEMRGELMGRAPAEPTLTAGEPNKEVLGPREQPRGRARGEESPAGPPVPVTPEPAAPVAEAPKPAAPEVPSVAAPTPAPSGSEGPKAPPLEAPKREVLPNMVLRDEVTAQRVADGINKTQPWADAKVVRTRKGVEIEAVTSPPPGSSAASARTPGITRMDFRPKPAGGQVNEGVAPERAVAPVPAAPAAAKAEEPGAVKAPPASNAEAAAPPHDPAHVGVVNAYAKRFPEAFPAEIQGALLRNAAANDWTPARLTDRARGWAEFASAAKPKGDVRVLHEDFEKAFGTLMDRVTGLREMTGLRDAMEKEAGGASPSASKLFIAHREGTKAEGARLKGLWDDARARLLDAVATKKGEPLADAVYKIQKDLEAKIEPTVADWRDPQGPGLGMFPGPIGQWMYDRALRGIKNAREQQARGAGREANHARVVDARGNAILTERLKYEPDPWTEHAAYRVLSHLRVLGGNQIYTPELQRESDVAVSSYPWMEGHMRDMAHDIMGEEFARDFKPGSSLSRELFKAVQGEKNALPGKYDHLVARWKRLFDEFHGILESEAAARGEDAPGYVEKYAPHITAGKKPDGVLRLVRALTDERAGGAEVAEKVNRFMEQRTGDPRYEKDAMWALESYIKGVSRWYAFNPFFSKVSDYLETGQLTEPRRAAVIRDHVISHFFRNKSRWEEIVDSGMRAAIFRRTAGFTSEVSAGIAGKMLGEDLPPGRYVYVAPETEAAFPPGWRHVGTSPDGGTVWAGAGGLPRAMGVPELREPFNAIAQKMTEAKLRASKEFGIDEAHVRERLVRERDLARLERDPASYILGKMSRNTLRAFMGWNVKAITQNAMNNVLTGIPEHGLAATMQGYLKHGPAAFAQAHRAGIDFLERSGHMSHADADLARAGLPLHRGEYFPKALGALQGEVQRTLAEHTESPTATRVVARMLAPLKGYQLVEDFTRGVDAVSAIMAGERMGLAPAKVAEFIASDVKTREAAWQAVTEQLRDPGSAESYAARMAGRTMFHYDFRGRGALFAGPFGQMLGLLSTFPVNFTLNYYVRPITGLGSVAAAAGRRAIGMTKAPGPGRTGADSRFEARGSYPAPSNPLAEWLEKGGAGFEARSAAKTAAYQILMTGALVGLNQVLPFTASVTGLAGWSLGVLGLAAMAMQDIPETRRVGKWLGKAVQGGAKNVAEAYTGRNPALELFWNSGQTLGRAMGAAQAKANTRSKMGGKLGAYAEGAYKGLDPTLGEFVRQQTIPGLVELRRIVQENPRFVDDNAPWLYKALGIKSKYNLKTPAQHLRFQTGTMKEQERKKAMRPTNPPASTYHPKPLSAA